MDDSEHLQRIKKAIAGADRYCKGKVLADLKVLSHWMYRDDLDWLVAMTIKAERYEAWLGWQNLRVIDDFANLEDYTKYFMEFIENKIRSKESKDE